MINNYNDNGNDNQYDGYRGSLNNLLNKQFQFFYYDTINMLHTGC